MFHFVSLLPSLCLSLSLLFIPTCQVRVVRFYISSSSSSSSSSFSSFSSSSSAGPQPRPSTPSFPCRTSTTTIHAQCSLPNLNHDHPRPVFPARPQPRPSAPSVPCRTSTTTIRAQRSQTHCACLMICPNLPQALADLASNTPWPLC